jgi:sugar-specific transcriptional regulator TrmB
MAIQIRAIEELYVYLKQFGLTDYQAQGTAAVMILGKATAREVSKNTNIQMKHVHRTMQELGYFGLIETIETRPMLYIAKPDEVLERLIGMKEEKLEKLQSKGEDLLGTIEDYQSSVKLTIEV